MKNKVTFKLITLPALILTVIAEVVFAVQLFVLNLLPGEYSLLVVLLLLLVPVLMFLAWYKGKKKPLRYIVLWLVSLAMIAGCVFGTTALHKLQTTLDAISGQEEDTGIYVGVYVLKDDAAQGIQDTKAYTFGFSDADANYDPQEAIQGISILLDTTINAKEYDSAFALAEALKAKEVDAILVNTAFAELYEDVEGYETFLTDTKLLYEHSVQEREVPPSTEPDATGPEGSLPEEDEEEPTEPEKPAEQIQVSREPFILYLSGSDTRAAKLRTSRTDVNILAVVNPTTKQILLINTPRDYYVTLGGTKDSKDKLTHSSMYGMKTSVRTMEKLYNCDVSYYARINFNGFEKLIDAIGGIDIHSDVKFITDDDIWIYEGDNHLNGEQALSFARERHHLKGGDNARGKNQMKVIAAVVDKVTSGTTIITKYTEILESLEGMFVTDMPTEKISELVQLQLAEMPKWEILSYAVTGTGTYDYTYSIPNTKTYVMTPHTSKVKQAKSLIKSVMKGQVLTEEDLSNS